MSNRVTVICVGPSPAVRGGITRVIEQIRGRVADDIRFRVIGTFSQYTARELPKRGSSVVQAIVFMGAIARVLAAAIFPRGKIFHVHVSVRGSMLRKGTLCVILRLLRCRYMVHTHAAEDSLFHEWVPKPVRRALMWGIGGADYVLALTRFWGDYYARTMRLPADKLLHLPNPVNLPALVPSRGDQEGINILFLGRIGKRKGAFEAIQAFAELPAEIRKRSRLTLAGDGENDAARELAAQLGCSSQTLVLDWVDRKEADRLLAEADVFLLPSRGEGMSMALLEAMAWGLAVITTASGGADEFLGPHRNCILVQPGDVQDISSALRKLAEDPHLRLRLGEEARKTATSFSIDNYVAKLTCLYQELASSSPQPSRIQVLFTAK
jgi:glycosyltransferase involved in cell wall biosynthesis